MANAASDTRDGNDETIGARLPSHMIEALDRKVATMRAAAPGATITRSDALRALLLLGLSVEGVP